MSIILYYNNKKRFRLDDYLQKYDQIDWSRHVQPEGTTIYFYSSDKQRMMYEGVVIMDSVPYKEMFDDTDYSVDDSLNSFFENKDKEGNNPDVMRIQITKRADETDGALSQQQLGERGFKRSFGQSMVKLDNYPELESYLQRTFDRYPLCESNNRVPSILSKKDMYIQQLESCKNLILNGAPGTGKTFLAKQIAEEMGNNCQFVQFHPSYDYTDFVEGLRPVSENGQIGFKRTDGVFKEFCKRALPYASIDGVFDALIRDINSRRFFTIPLKTQESCRLVVLKDNNIGWYENNMPTELADYSVSKENIKKLYNKFSTLDSLNSISNIDEEIRKVIGPCNSSYYYGILRYIIEKIGKKFVFIIDEINRGDMSKIFGELFFSIDPGYRGESGKVMTQYQNLIDSNDVFHEGFYVPENVYIIGTMNDIDRSVESMDFAMRRRFTFQEITAKDRQDAILGDNEEAKVCMNNLNAAIEKIPGLNASYHIGPAYFKDYSKEHSQALWNNKIKGLLYEYLRGMPNADDLLEKLKNSFDLKDATNDNDKPADGDGTNEGQQ